MKKNSNIIKVFISCALILLIIKQIDFFKILDLLKKSPKNCKRARDLKGTFISLHFRRICHLKASKY